MGMIDVKSFAAGSWIGSGESGARGVRPVFSAVTGEKVAVAGGAPLHFTAMLSHARDVGGPALRGMNFHDRAKALKALALYLTEHKEQLFVLSAMTGATRSDSAIDIEGGIGTLFAYASKGRRELPDAFTFVDGDVEMLSRSGSFVGQHICVPKRGVGVHINAFNFPVWGMLEKLACTLLAGVPAIVKPATATCYVTEACFRLMLASNTFPEGAFQLIIGGTGDLLEQLTPQDVVSFTGSAETAFKLRSNSHLLRHSIPFIAEQDSLNATLLGSDAAPGSPEFDLLVQEVVREMTAKAGQKCTAIRRVLVPETFANAALEAITAKLRAIQIGHPDLAETQMGALVSQEQRDSVRSISAQIEKEARAVFPADDVLVNGADADAGAFMAPQLFHCSDPDKAQCVHNLEAFGPVATLMPFRDLEHGCALLNRGGGSLVASVVTHDPTVAKTVADASAAWHGRLYINNRDSAREATGHGSPMPQMVHGGPGRAGGGEELGGIRGVMHYMQRTAIQGSPNIVSAVGETWIPGAAKRTAPAHPFTRGFDQLTLGETINTEFREITLDDIEHFAHFTGDTFYAHMDEEAAKANPFFPGRVAHGYLLLSFAAGLFVEPNPGPVLANTGLADLAFQKPVAAGDSIKVALTVKRKTRRTDTYGEVRWHVELTNQDDEPVASYTLFTMNAY